MVARSCVQWRVFYPTWARGENEVGVLPPGAYFTPPFTTYILTFFRGKDCSPSMYSLKQSPLDTVRCSGRHFAGHIAPSYTQWTEIQIRTGKASQPTLYWLLYKMRCRKSSKKECSSSRTTPQCIKLIWCKNGWPIGHMKMGLRSSTGLHIRPTLTPLRISGNFLKMLFATSFQSFRICQRTRTRFHDWKTPPKSAGWSWEKRCWRRRLGPCQTAYKRSLPLKGGTPSISHRLNTFIRKSCLSASTCGFFLIFKRNNDFVVYKYVKRFAFKFWSKVG